MAQAGVSANRLELLQIADAVAREKAIDHHESDQLAPHPEHQDEAALVKTGADVVTEIEGAKRDHDLVEQAAEPHSRRPEKETAVPDRGRNSGTQRHGMDASLLGRRFGKPLAGEQPRVQHDGEAHEHEAVPPAPREQSQERQESRCREIAGAPHERPSDHHALPGVGVGVHEHGL